MVSTRVQLEALSQRLRAVEEQWRPDENDEAVQTVEAGVGSLRRRRLHEWLGVDACSQEAKEDRTMQWMPAQAVLMDAAARAWQQGGGGLVVWIGRKVWPYAVSLPANVAIDSVLIDPRQAQERLWAIDLAMRSHAVTAVVADGSGLNLRATRRLQLAAEAGRSLAMLARPGDEAAQRSAAAYRWKVRALPVEMHEKKRNPPRWEVELFRGKDATTQQAVPVASDVLSVSGQRWSSQSTRRIVEWRHGEGLVTVPAVVVDPAAQANARLRDPEGRDPGVRVPGVRRGA